MAHELDDQWTLYIVRNIGGGVFDAVVDGKLNIRVRQDGTGNLDPAYSNHDPGGMNPNRLDGRVTTSGTGYQVGFTETLANGHHRDYTGALATRIHGTLVMAGVRGPERVTLAKKNRGKALTGQEDGVWVATKP